MLQLLYQLRVNFAVSVSIALQLPVASGDERLDALGVIAQHLFDDPLRFAGR